MPPPPPPPPPRVPPHGGVDGDEDGEGGGGYRKVEGWSEGEAHRCEGEESVGPDPALSGG